MWQEPGAIGHSPTAHWLHNHTELTPPSPSPTPFTHPPSKRLKNLPHMITCGVPPPEGKPCRLLRTHKTQPVAESSDFPSNPVGYLPTFPTLFLMHRITIIPASTVVMRIEPLQGLCLSHIHPPVALSNPLVFSFLAPSRRSTTTPARRRMSSRARTRASTLTRTKTSQWK